jgi:hypothetical protein
MSILVYGILLFTAALLIHLIIWRVHLPKKQTNTLLVIFSLVIVLGVLAIFRYPGLIRWSIFSFRNIFEIFQLSLLYTTISVAYILSYPAIEVDSPTLIIIKAVFATGAAGLEKSSLEKLANNDLLILPRVRDMVFDRMVYVKDGKYKLMPKGLIMAKLFSCYRNIIGGGHGG